MLLEVRDLRLRRGDGRRRDAFGRFAVDAGGTGAIPCLMLSFVEVSRFSRGGVGRAWRGGRGCGFGRAHPGIGAREGWECNGRSSASRMKAARSRTRFAAGGIGERGGRLPGFGELRDCANP